MNQPNLAPSQSSSGTASRNTAADASLQAYQSELAYLLGTLRRLGVDQEDIEDLAHEVFLVLRRMWWQYDPQRPLKPYLFGIAFRVAASHRRKYWREVPFAIVDEADRGPSADRTVEANQAHAVVHEALKRVPLKRRAVLVMHDLDEIPVQEVAATLSIPLFTVYSRLRKARHELEAAITEIQTRSVP